MAPQKWPVLDQSSTNVSIIRFTTTKNSHKLVSVLWAHTFIPSFLGWSVSLRFFDLRRWVELMNRFWRRCKNCRVGRDKVLPFVKDGTRSTFFLFILRLRFVCSWWQNSSGSIQHALILSDGRYAWAKRTRRCRSMRFKEDWYSRCRGNDAMSETNWWEGAKETRRKDELEILKLAMITKDGRTTWRGGLS